MRRFTIIAVLAAAAGMLLRMFIVEGIYVASASMEPTFPVGTYLFLEKITFRLREPQQGDIVVLRSPVQEKKDLIKRIIAVPGDTIEMKRKKVYINGMLLQEPYVQYTRPHEELQGDTIPSMTVPEDMFFVMGDNRDESKDSRDWIHPENGTHQYFVRVEAVKGKVVQFK